MSVGVARLKAGAGKRALPRPTQFVDGDGNLHEVLVAWSVNGLGPSLYPMRRRVYIGRYDLFVVKPVDPVGVLTVVRWGNQAKPAEMISAWYSGMKPGDVARFVVRLLSAR